MALRPEVSITTGLALGTMAIAFHQKANPPMTDVRMTTPGAIDHEAVDRARKQATWMAAAAVAFTSLITKDANVFIVGGAIVVGVDWWTRYSNEITPELQRFIRPEAQQPPAEAPIDAAEADVNLEVVGY